jgi:hypothetical protein
MFRKLGVVETKVIEETCYHSVRGDIWVLNLKTIYDDCKLLFELDKEKHYIRMRKHDTTKGDDAFCKLCKEP